jgi:hypothetical protein
MKTPLKGVQPSRFSACPERGRSMVAVSNRIYLPRVAPRDTATEATMSKLTVHPLGDPATSCVINPTLVDNVPGSYWFSELCHWEDADKYEHAQHPSTAMLRNCLMLLTLVMMILGGECFFVFELLAADVIVLPLAFEWPVGVASGAARTLDGQYIVPLQSPARVQLYDSNLRFVRGWHVDTEGKSFTVAPSAKGTIDVYPNAGQIRLKYTEAGDLVSTESIYVPDVLLNARSSDWLSGVAITVPTPLWRILVFNPFFYWLVAAFGGVLRFLLRRQAMRRANSRETAFTAK